MSSRIQWIFSKDLSGRTNRTSKLVRPMIKLIRLGLKRSKSAIKIRGTKVTKINLGEPLIRFKKPIT
jgi:hypothetical protein